ncbi:hypothetical protein I4U23_023211 [Adineta vaga]|nr:hypothetical protein I4U23_023211 [Adineta vaga]
MLNRYFKIFILIEWIWTPVYLQMIWQSKTKISDAGFKFSPIDEQSLFLFQYTASSLITCTTICHSTTRCRIFDYDDQTHQCRLFEGDLTTMGSIIVSSSSQSRVGSIQMSGQQFLNVGQPCSFCQGNTYLICLNTTCQCPLHTYFDGIICRSQRLLGATCNTSRECRTDLNYTCLPRQQCGPLSVLNGVTVAGNANGAAGSTSSALNNPMGIAVDSYGSIYVSDYNNSRVIRFQEGSLNGTIVAGTGTAGSSNMQLKGPSGIHVDSSSNIYVSDSWNYRVMFWQKNAFNGSRVAGTGVYGNSFTTFDTIAAVVVDSLRNIYISDPFHNRVVRWAMNASTSTLVAGTGIAGNNNQRLKESYGLYLDESNSDLYIADTGNSRIQLYKTDNPNNGTTVAGGNGPGTGSNQLNMPVGIISQDCLQHLKTIVDRTSARIVLSSSWKLFPKSRAQIESRFKDIGIEPLLGWTSSRGKTRVDEIYYWLKFFDNKTIEDDISIKKWIVIDDMDLLKLDKKRMENHFVLTEEEHGITDETVKEAIRLLS